GQWLAVPLLEALQERVDVLALVDGIEHLVELLAGRPRLLAGQVLRPELLAHEPVQRVRAALGDPVGDRRGAVLDGGPRGLDRLGQRGAQLLLELGDLGEHGGMGVELGGAVGEGAPHEHVAQLLHERVFGAAGVVGVGEHGLALDLHEHVLLAEPRGVEVTSGVGLGVELGGAVGEGALDEHVAKLLHERVVGAAGVVGVREHGLALDLHEHVLLAEPGGVEVARGGVGAQRPLGHRRHAALDGALDVLLDVAKVDGLAQRDEERGAHELENVDGLGGLPGGDEAEGVDVLVVLLRALHVVGDRVAQELQLRAVGRHGDLGALEAVVQARVPATRQVGGQAVVVEVVDELGELREHELADGGDGEAGVVHGHADGRALEVAAVDRLAAGDVDERVVVDGVDLALDGFGGGADDLDLGPEPLRRRAERVPVLLRLHQRVQLAHLLGELHVGAAFQEVLHDGGRLDLARVVLELVGEVVRVLGLPVHHLAEHGGEHLGEDGQDVGLEQHGGREPGPHGRAVHHGEPFLGLQLEEATLDSRDPERLGRVHLAAVRRHRHRVLAAGDEPRDVGERHEVARRGDGAPQRQARRHVGVEQLRHRLQDLEPDARVALQQRVDADEHGGRVASAGSTWPLSPAVPKAPALRKRMSSLCSAPPSLVRLWDVAPKPVVTP
ncbi:hypothetical protein EJB05_06115, partial [Eragrostis curvula]